MPSLSTLDHNNMVPFARLTLAPFGFVRSRRLKLERNLFELWQQCSLAFPS